MITAATAAQISLAATAASAASARSALSAYSDASQLSRSESLPDSSATWMTSVYSRGNRPAASSASVIVPPSLIASTAAPARAAKAALPLPPNDRLRASGTGTAPSYIRYMMRLKRASARLRMTAPSTGTLSTNSWHMRVTPSALTAAT
jgi:hypothetical protein